MKISIEHFPMRQRFGEEKALKMIKDAGFDGVDYSFNELGNGQAIDLSNHTAKAKKVKKLLDGLELDCTQAHAPFGLKYGVKFDMQDKQFADTVRSIEFSSILGVKEIVVHSIFMPDNTNFFDHNYGFYKSLEPYAKDCGVQIAVENLVNSIFWKPNRLSQFIRMLDSSVFCACVDVGHSMLMGTSPEEFISGMDKGVMKCVHIQDTDGKIDRHWIPYQGIQNWDNIMKSLAEYGYNGALDMEIVHAYDNLPDELCFSALKYTADVGKFLAAKFEKIKQN